MPESSLLNWRIRKAREARGWSRTRLARRANIPLDSLIVIEAPATGDRVHVGLVAQLAEALDVSLDSLVWGSASEVEDLDDPGQAGIL